MSGQNVAIGRLVRGAAIRLSLSNLRAPLVVTTVLLVSSCAGAPPYPVAGPDPSDPRVQVPRVTYGSTLGSYTSQRPVDPKPWTEQNERVAPQPKSGQ